MTSTIRNWLAHWVASILALFVITKLNIGITATDLPAMFMVVLAMSLFNSFIRPIILFFAWPINCLTFGLFGFALNIILFKVMGSGFIPGFHVTGFLAPVIGSVLMGALSGIFSFALSDKQRR